MIKVSRKGSKVLSVDLGVRKMWFILLWLVIDLGNCLEENSFLLKRLVKNTFTNVEKGGGKNVKSFSSIASILR